MNTKQMHIYVADRGEESNKLIPEWMRTILIDEDGGCTLYVPSCIVSDDVDRVLKLASIAAVQVATYLGHYYVPMSWAKVQHYKAHESCKIIADTFGFENN